MKMNKYLAFMAVAVSMAACSNEEEILADGGNDAGLGVDNKVFVTLSLGSPASRALENTAANKYNEINSLDIYFYNAANVYVNATVPEDKITAAIAALKSGNHKAVIELEDIPASASKMYVIANQDQNHPIDKGSLDKAKQTVIYLADQVKTEDVKDFSGEASTLTGVGAIQNSSEAGKWQADVDLTPVSSRIEVQNFIAKSAPADYPGEDIKSFTVEGIYINAFYKTGVLDPDTKQSQEARVDNGSDESKYSVETGYANYLYMCDEPTYAPAENPNAVSSAYTEEEKIWKVSPVVENKWWGYQILPGEVPNIVVKLKVTLENGVLTDSVRYLTVNAFRKATGNDALQSVKRGEVYQIQNLEFDASNLTETPYETTKTVSATVSVKAWVPVGIVPDFNQE